VRVVGDWAVDDIYPAAGCGVRAKSPEITAAAEGERLGTVWTGDGVGHGAVGSNRGRGELSRNKDRGVAGLYGKRGCSKVGLRGRHGQQSAIRHNLRRKHTACSL
jgi:hypothetical protein